MISNSNSLLLTWFEEVWNQHNVSAIAELLDPHAVVFDLTGFRDDIIGPAQFKIFYHEFLAEFPAFKVSVMDVKKDGEYEYGMAHIMTEDQETKTAINFSAPVNIRIRDGKIIEVRDYIETYCWEKRAAIQNTLPQKSD